MIKIASALIVYDHKLLLHLRDGGHPDPNLKNKWGLVGGTIEQDENPLTAVRREIKEETNLNPNNVEYLGKLEISKSEGKMEAHLFCSRLTDKETKQLKLGNEGTDVRFFTTVEIANLSLSPEVKKYYLTNHEEIDSFINDGVIPKIKT